MLVLQNMEVFLRCASYYFLILAIFIQVVVSDYAAMDRVLREERAYILNIVKQVSNLLLSRLVS